MIDSIEKYGGLKVSFDMSIQELQKIAKEHEIEIDARFEKGKIINEIFEKIVEAAFDTANIYKGLSDRNISACKKTSKKS